LSFLLMGTGINLSGPAGAVTSRWMRRVEVGARVGQVAVASAEPARCGNGRGSRSLLSYIWRQAHFARRAEAGPAVVQLLRTAHPKTRRSCIRPIAPDETITILGGGWPRGAAIWRHRLPGMGLGRRRPAPRGEKGLSRPLTTDGRTVATPQFRRWDGAGRPRGRGGKGRAAGSCGAGAAPGRDKTRRGRLGLEFGFRLDRARSADRRARRCLPGPT